MRFLPHFRAQGCFRVVPVLCRGLECVAKRSIERELFEPLVRCRIDTAREYLFCLPVALACLGECYGRILPVYDSTSLAADPIIESP
jgi:hypothetical protein